MALDITNSDIGYNSEGLNAAFENIKTKVIDDTIEKMKDSKDTFTEWLHSAWVGHSADTFENNFFTQEIRLTIVLKKSEAALRTQFAQILKELAHADSELIKEDSLGLSDF